MQKRNLDNKTLDVIGRRLIEIGSPRSSDIETIISNQRLFDLVSTRIAENGKTPFPKRLSGRDALSFVRRHTIAFAGVALVFIAVIIGAAGLLKSEKTQMAGKVQVPDAVPEVARPDFPPKPVVSKLSAGRAFDRKNQIEKSLAIQAPKRVERKTQTNAPREPEG